MLKYFEEKKELWSFFARWGLALTLLFSTYVKWTSPEMVADLLNQMVGFGTPGLILFMAAALDVLAILLMIGLWTRGVAALLSLFFLVTLVSGLNVGIYSVGPGVWKDFALLGASLALLFGGSEAMSLDAKLKK